jgi:hypothetical protein
VASLFRVRTEDNVCAVATIPLGSEYRSLGEPVPADDHPAFDEVIAAGPGRLRRRTIKAPGGRSVGSSWFDAEKNTICSPILTDGKYRCASGIIPSSLYLFADAECTEALWDTAPGACPTPYVITTLSQDACSDQRTIYATGEAYTGDRYFRAVIRSESGVEVECIPDTVSRDRTFNRLTPVPADEFVEMKVIEP